MATTRDPEAVSGELKERAVRMVFDSVKPDPGAIAA